MKTVYKIKNPNTGLYSTGGLYPNFNATGKTWSSLKNLKLHLLLFSVDDHYAHNPTIKLKDLVVEEIVPTVVNVHYIDEYFLDND